VQIVTLAGFSMNAGLSGLHACIRESETILRQRQCVRVEMADGSVGW
jgi:hypothetical protein